MLTNSGNPWLSQFQIKPPCQVSTWLTRKALPKTANSHQQAGLSIVAKKSIARSISSKGLSPEMLDSRTRPNDERKNVSHPPSRDAILVQLFHFGKTGSLKSTHSRHSLTWVASKPDKAGDVKRHWPWLHLASGRPQTWQKWRGSWNRQGATMSKAGTG